MIKIWYIKVYLEMYKRNKRDTKEKNRKEIIT